MPEQGRLGDKSEVGADSHGCPACPHPAIGPAVGGSSDVIVNGKPALRVGDPGIHGACCGPNTWTADAGSASVFINGKKAHRKGDAVVHCGGNGKLVDGSPDVFVGDQAETTKQEPPPEAALVLAIVDPFGNPMERTFFDAVVSVNGEQQRRISGFTQVSLSVREGDEGEVVLTGPVGSGG